MSHDRHAWLDDPRIAAHYRQRAAIDGLSWEAWVTARLGRPPVSLQLACGPATRSFFLYESRFAAVIDGIDNSEDAILAAERSREACRAPGQFRVGDPATTPLPRGRYDLVFISHALHPVVDLESLFAKAYDALAPDGLFVVEGYVGPSRFQWTEAQMAMVTLALTWLPERLRLYRWGAPKTREGRPERDAVAGPSPFEAIRSGEIVKLFRRQFETVVERRLGGSLQLLLYNGIIHNFADDDPEASAHIERAWQLEDALVDAGLLESDFRLIVGKKR